ncbi:putative serine protease [Xenorhabdus bovienii str. Jollieti]|uniref:Putative serine protease n=2 Tax=Xenorhabdus bovienii TaxID=40576 RepID=D3V0H9_XENBS|nr:putative serine protease [Xenorhabdus bovienii SS-2004]CDH30309.1 putative serine protease [Xenorhabdus bovienii str. Jollieti]
MTEQYKHLSIAKESLQNPRRTRQFNIPRTPRADLRLHGSMLSEQLRGITQLATPQIPGKDNDGRYMLKLQYTGMLDIAHLDRHGIEFVSQEDKTICIAFADERGIALFEEHLSQLGHGHITYQQILTALDSVDVWSSEDRKSWSVRHYGFPELESFGLDVELWPIETTRHPSRERICEEFENWLQENMIHRLDRINLDSLLMYRVRVNCEQAEKLLAHRDVRMVDLLPSSGISYEKLNRDINVIPAHIPSPSPDAAKVCILDSGINTAHPLLRSAIAESASFVVNEDEFDHCGHGTAVAGIALYGDVEACDASNFWQPSVWLYNGKLLNSQGEFDTSTIETTLTEAVEYFVDLGCRIFNLSLGNANAPYDGKHIRGIAYVLDVLARRHNILFVVSAGNFSGSSDPDVPQESWRAEYPSYLIHNSSVIIDPAPALNVLTTGSYARHNATFDAQRRADEISHLSPAGEFQPSPFTRHGPSVKGAFKPEIVAHGGNFAVPMRNDGGQWREHAKGLGVLSCHHQFQGSTFFSEQSGTSFSAPYITHLAGRLLNEYPDMSANMLRAMLVNHAVLTPQMENTFSEEVVECYKAESATRNRSIIRDVVGYGVVEEDSLYRSSEEVVVMMCDEQIVNNTHQFFELPLPASFLRTQRAVRELHITLAYSPAVRTTRLDYAATQISYRLIKGTSLQDVQQYFNHDVQDGTKSRNDDAASNRSVTAQQRDHCTVQSSSWTFKRRSPDEKWFVVVTRNDREWGAPLNSQHESYALVVTATDRENAEANLYAEIEARIREQERSRARVS